MDAGTLVPTLFGVTLMAGVGWGVANAVGARRARKKGVSTNLAKHDKPVGREEQAD